MNMQSKMNNTSLPVLARIAAKVLQIMWPDSYSNVVIQETENGYSVIQHDSPLITAYRDENNNHYITAELYDLFIEEYNSKWEYHPHTREQEFDDLFYCFLNNM